MKVSIAMLMGVIFLTGCGLTDICDQVEVTNSESVATIIDFNWTGEGDGSLEWGYAEGDYTRSASGGSSEEHEASVLGAKPLSDIYYRVVNSLNGKEKTCKGVATTANPPSGIADLQIDSYDASLASEDEFLIGSAMMGDPSLFVIDRDGDMVWYYAIDEDRLTTDVSFERGTNNLYYNSYASSYDIDDGYVMNIDLHHNVLTETRVELGHHFFEELPDGSLTYMQIDVRDVEPGPDWSIEDCDANKRSEVEGVEYCSVVGHRIVEIPADGSDPVTLISTFDIWDVVPYEDWDLGFYPQGMSWLHANALNYDDERDTYLWSFAGYDTFLEVSRDGTILRSFGDFGDYKGILEEYPKGEEGWDFQHDPNWTEDGNLLMFVYDDDSGCYAVEFEVDDANQTLTEVWQYGRGERLRVHALGTARRLANGNTMINWGSAGVVREVTPAGEVAWDMYSKSGTFFGSTYSFGDFYTGE